jgi:hypothetical protein
MLSPVLRWETINNFWPPNGLADALSKALSLNQALEAAVVLNSIGAGIAARVCEIARASISYEIWEERRWLSKEKAMAFRVLQLPQRLKSRPGPQCRACRHPDRQAIDLAIVAGQSKREIAAKYGLSPSSVQRHRETCVPKDLVEAERNKRFARGEYVLAASCALDRDARAIYLAALNSGKSNVALSAVSERRRILALQSGFRALDKPAELASKKINEAQLLKKAIVNALEPFPDARVAVADALSKPRRP